MTEALPPSPLRYALARAAEHVVRRIKNTLGVTVAEMVKERSREKERVTAGTEYERMGLSDLLHQLSIQPSAGGSPRDRIMTMIQVRLAEMQETSARELADATRDLVNKTAGIVRATWWLVAATAALILTEIGLRLFGRGGS